MSRAGRKRNPDAKRHKTTKLGRAPVDRGTDQLQGKHALLDGRISVEQAMWGNEGPNNLGALLATTAPRGRPVGLESPLEIMAARGQLKWREAAAGRDFAMTAWALFGMPFAKCEGVYERMISGLAPGIGIDHDAPETENERIKARKERRQRHKDMVRLLNPPGSSTEILTAVQNAAQFLILPRLVVEMIQHNNPSLDDPRARSRLRPADLREMEALQEGLRRLADWRERASQKAA